MMKKLFVIISLLFFASSAYASQDIIHEYRPELNQQRKGQLAQQVMQLSHRYDVDTTLVFAIVIQESGFVNKQSECSQRVNDDGTCEHYTTGHQREESVGYMQVSRQTFQRVMGYRTTIDRMVYDWKETLEAGVKYLSEQQHKYGYYDGISAYNAGIPVKENSEYMEGVLDNYNELQE